MPLPLSIVIVTRNRANELLRSLKHLTALPERPAIIVIDNASTDGTATVVREHFPQIDVSALGRNLGAAARTYGVLRADTPFVAFNDDDSWWVPGSLDQAARVLATHSTLGLVAGRVLLGPEGIPDPACELMENSPLPARSDLPGKPVLGFVACGAIVRRTAYLETGGFNLRYGVGGEEHLLAVDLAAAGWDLVYRNDIVARHFPSNARDLARRRRTVLRNDLWSAWLRRPWDEAMRRTWQLLRPPPPMGSRMGGLWDALWGLPWVMRERRPLPRHLARHLALLERAPS